MQDGNQGGVFFNLCNSITATNGTFYYTFSQNPWYQATITGMANQGTVWNITVTPLQYLPLRKLLPCSHG